ncbi:MAG: hypothetical protein NVSMB70_06980 [Chamaesiphon sp.]
MFQNLKSDLLSGFSVRSLVILTLVAGSTALAVVDPTYRPKFADLAEKGLIGYLALSQPGRIESIKPESQKEE